jgi:hypothetical protein
MSQHADICNGGKGNRANVKGCGATGGSSANDACVGKHVFPPKKRYPKKIVI